MPKTGMSYYYPFALIQVPHGWVIPIAPIQKPFLAQPNHLNESNAVEQEASASPNGANRMNKNSDSTRTRISLFVRGFPYGSMPCHELEQDLYMFFSNWAPIERVEACADPSTGWIHGAYLRFIHETYAQAVLEHAPYFPFYGFFLSIEPVRGDATLRFRLIKNVCDDKASGNHFQALCPTSRTSHTRHEPSGDETFPQESATDASLELMQLVKGLVHNYGDIELVTELFYGQDYVLDVTFVQREQAVQVLNVSTFLIQGVPQEPAK